MNDPKRNGFKFFVLALIALAGFVVNHTDQIPIETTQQIATQE